MTGVFTQEYLSLSAGSRLDLELLDLLFCHFKMAYLYVFGYFLMLHELVLFCGVVLVEKCLHAAMTYH